MAHAKHTADDSGTLTSTIDFGSTSSITAAGPNSSVGNIAQNFLGRFPNTSQNNVVQPVPNPLNVWGPHQHQAATRGYEYPTYQNGSGRAPSRSDPRLNGYGASASTDASPVSPSPGTASPNASFPHIAAGAAGAAFPSSSSYGHGHGHGHGPGPSPLGAGAGTPRKSSSRGELANKAAAVPPQPLIAAAGNASSPSTPPSASSKQARDRTPPSAGSGARSTGSASSRPEVPRLNTAVGNASKAKALPPAPPQQQPTTPPRQTTPKTPQSQTPPAATAGATATPPSPSSKPAAAVVPRPPPANGSRSVRERERLAAYDLERGEGGAGERRHYRTRSQEYGAAASYHNAGFATGGSVCRRNNNHKKENGEDGGVDVVRGRSVGRGGALVAGHEAERFATQEKTGGGGGWADVTDAVAGAANMVARSFDDLHARSNAMGASGVGARGINREGFGSHRRVTSPLSADNAREKLRRKLSRQGSGFFDQDGIEGRGEREGFEGRL
ncbi:hypothetical protein BKA80DRAFT_278658 [Phyllosticta citrichinensis]